MWDLFDIQPKLNNVRTKGAVRILKSLNKVTKNKTLGKDRGICVNLLLEGDWKTNSNKMGTHIPLQIRLRMICSLFHSHTHISETHLSS